jgi:hypothetical protein
LRLSYSIDFRVLYNADYYSYCIFGGFITYIDLTGGVAGVGFRGSRRNMLG